MGTSYLTAVSLPLTLALLITCSRGQDNPTDSGLCYEFKWDQVPAYVSTKDNAIRVSAAGNCRGSNHPCAITSLGDQLFEASSNISSFYRSTEGAQAYYSMVADITKDDVSRRNNSAGAIPSFNASIVAAVDQTLMLDPGQTAYTNFKPLQMCYTGTTGNCTGDIANDTPIEVCAPVWNRRQRMDGLPHLSGSYELVNISANDEGLYPNPYEGTSVVQGFDSSSTMTKPGFLALSGLFTLMAVFV